ncbi:Cu(I)-responsive transcriptional regulator [Rheinheimera nanhaiensis]|uniref:MerR family transcriptional regulator, copper efflux regulator n=1 Tax=Rheinheimera nanhaiensis E407-8 TaxID=562729 RepID=I1E096_9GAMM|nr:Cu(I)-responsive transcriptional regulator [Rheinheimera nanhaiensis]GAB59724.1 MerR family transcriptional regulator, copper efflux regulator [Rheinheimera nanhaiensis E407-8]
MATLLTIGAAAKASGLTAKMIRHYEQSGLLQKPPRTDAGYRLYNSQQLQQLSFIQQARRLGFSLSEIGSLLQLWQDPARESRAVKQLAEQHLADIAEKIAELQNMQQLLQQLADSCSADSSPDCAILAALAPANGLK